MTIAPRWITESDVTSVLDMGVAIGAIARVLEREAAGEASSMAKTHTTWGSGATLHAIGGVSAGDGVVGTKTWAHTEGGATPLLVLFDAHTGALRAIIEAFALGQLRTGAVSGVATDRLALHDADRLAVIGTGKQALAQVAAVAAVRPLEGVRVFGRDRDRRDAFARKVEERLELDAVSAASVEDAVENVPIITLVTRATAPFLSSRMVAEGAHVNAIGAIVPERAEFEPDLLARCGVVAADSVVQVRQLSSEMREFYGRDDDRWGAVRPLSDVSSRPTDADVTLFKAMGVGLCDLALGLECLARAEAADLGRGIPPTVRVEPDFRSESDHSQPSRGARR